MDMDSEEWTPMISLKCSLPEVAEEWVVVDMVAAKEEDKVDPTTLSGSSEHQCIL